MNHVQFLALQKLPGVELRINRSAATELVARGAVSARAKMYERISAKCCDAWCCCDCAFTNMV